MASLDQFLQDLDDLDDEQAEGADEEVQDEEVDEDEDIDMMGEDVQPASTSGLLASGRLDELIERIEDLMVQTGPTDSEAEYAAIVACNEMVIDADTEVMSIAKNIKDDYAKRMELRRSNSSLKSRLAAVESELRSANWAARREGERASRAEALYLELKSELVAREKQLAELRTELRKRPPPRP